MIRITGFEEVYFMFIGKVNKRPFRISARGLMRKQLNKRHGAVIRIITTVCLFTYLFKEGIMEVKYKSLSRMTSRRRSNEETRSKKIVTKMLRKSISCSKLEESESLSIRHSDAVDSRTTLPIIHQHNVTYKQGKNYKEKPLYLQKRESFISKDNENDLCDRVNMFMKDSIPGKPPSTLRICKSIGHTFKQQRDSTTTTNEENMSLGIPINTHTCPNLTKDRTLWYYSHRKGRCRYLRYPLSPVLRVEEIFNDI